MKTRKRKFKKIHQCIELKVIKQDLSDEQSVDMVAMTVMDLLEDRLSSELLELLKEMLLGFSPDMQLEIADDLLDFTCGRVIHTTGCMSADAVLKACYSWIADEKGFELA
jgi:hypothetical protein